MRGSAVAALALALVAVLGIAVPAEARVCSTCVYGYCNASVSTTECASCFPYYTGSNCDSCVSTAVAVTRNGTDLPLDGGAFDGTVGACITKCLGLTNYTVYAGITVVSGVPKCTCGLSYGNYGSAPSPDDCNPCASNATLRCGGDNVVSVYFMPTHTYKGCYNDPGSATLCEDNLATAAPEFNTDFTTASKILFGVFIGVCCIGAVYFIGLAFYCCKKQKDKKAMEHRSSAQSNNYML